MNRVIIQREEKLVEPSLNPGLWNIVFHCKTLQDKKDQPTNLSWDICYQHVVKKKELTGREIKARHPSRPFTVKPDCSVI